MVLNAAKIRVTGDKLRQKSYFRHSNYPGGLREESLGALLERKPELVIERAVKGCCRRTASVGRCSRS